VLHLQDGGHVVWTAALCIAILVLTCVSVLADICCFNDAYVCVCVKKAKKTAQLPALPSLSSLGKNVPTVPYTHLLPPVTFDIGNTVINCQQMEKKN